MEQTAVEYLYKIIHARIHIDKDLSEYLEQAKEMEKQQMCQFAFDYQDEFFNNDKVVSAEQYYNETFKSE